MRRVMLVVLAAVVVLSAEGLKAIHRQNLLAESVYQFDQLATGLHDTVGCDAVKIQLQDLKAVIDTTIATADTATRAAWKKEIDSVIVVVDSVRVVRKLTPIVLEPIEAIR